MIDELEKLKEGSPIELYKELELFFCNCNLDSKQRIKLLEIINKYIK